MLDAEDSMIQTRHACSRRRIKIFLSFSLLVVPSIQSWSWLPMYACYPEHPSLLELASSMELHLDKWIHMSPCLVNSGVMHDVTDRENPSSSCLGSLGGVLSTERLQM
jgi:hypothetical protein